MGIIQLAFYITFAMVLKFEYSYTSYCSCGEESCTNIQEGYNTGIGEYCLNDEGADKEACKAYLDDANNNIVVYRAGGWWSTRSYCRVLSCDHTTSLRYERGRTAYRKTCDTACLDYIIERHHSCLTEPSSATVKFEQTPYYSDNDCVRHCLPPNRSCIAVYDSRDKWCKVYDNVDALSSPPCTYDYGTYTYHVKCLQATACAMPDEIGYGGFYYTDSTSTSITYYCDDGYDLNGTATLTCQSNAWSPSTPNCVIKDCNIPPFVADATVSSSNETATTILTTYESSLIYSCNGSYVLIGFPNISCLANGSWSSPLPSCQFVDCFSPPNVTFATFPPSPITTFGASVNYSCNTGYTLMGSPNVTCLANGNWSSPLPSCQIVDCNPPPNVANAAVPPGSITTFGSTLTYSCDTGYNSSGFPSISCLADGSWESPSISCQIVDCDLPANVSDATVSPADSSETTISTTYGSAVVYSCSTGYTLSGSHNVTCLENGSWSSPLPSCQIVDCFSPPNVTYATIPPSTLTTYGSTVTYSCSTGYILIGNPNVTCLSNGSWSSPLPSCQIVDCFSPPNVTYASFPPSPITTFGASVNYSCDTGYTSSGISSISCLANGSWESPLITCQIVDCDLPSNVSHATVSPADTSETTISTTYGSTVVYSCSTGYTLSGSPSISCLASGLWENPLPTCQIVDCGDPPNVTDATVDVLNTTYLSTAVYECATFYNMVGQATVSCLDDGQWGPTFPVCNIVDCQTPLPNVTNATVTFTTTTFGSTATYTCLTNHTRIGSPSIVCQGNGVWSQPHVKCYQIVSGNSVSVKPKPLFITSCLCSTGSYFVDMTEDEIIAELISETQIDAKETTLAQSALICRQDNRTSSVIAGAVGITVLSCVFGMLFCLDLLSLCKHLKKPGTK